MTKLYPVRISGTIANEYDTRAVFGGEAEEYPEVPGEAGTHLLPLTTVQAIHDDADHQIEDGGFARDNCHNTHDRGIRNAYLALRSQMADFIKSATTFQPER